MSDVAAYEKMKDSGIEWIGSVPSHWRVHMLYQLVTQVKEKNSELLEKNLLSLSYGKIKRRDIDSPDGLLPASFDGYNIIEAGDIVLRLTDLQNDHTSLRVGLATERGIITSAYVTLRPAQTVISKYLYYLLHVFDLKKGFYGMGSGVRQGLNYDGVKELRIILPSNDEQSAIATYLDAICGQIDTLVEETKKNIEDYKLWKASIIEETITRGLNPNAKTKRCDLEWISEIPYSWKTDRLKALFVFGKGLPITKENLIEQGVPVISYGQIHAKYNNGTSITEPLLRYVPDSYVETNPESLVHEGDILVADTSEDVAGCGNCAYVDKEMRLFAGYHTIILRSVTRRDNKYLAYLFKTDAWRSQIRTRVSGVKLFSVSKKILNLATVILPPEEERAEIVRFLDEKCDAIDSLIDSKQALLVDLENYKRSLICEVVTGKRKVV